MTTISIVVPSYNHAEYIEACLDSIYFQDYPSLEIIIVDDCSTDNSREVIAAWIANIGQEEVSFASYYDEKTDVIKRTSHMRYSRQGRTICFLKNEKNLGSTATYNRGLQKASGELCSFVVSDDMCHPQMMSRLAAPLIAGEADFTYADMFVINDHGHILREFVLPDYDFDVNFGHWYLCGVATLYRRSLHDAYGWYDVSAQADDHECYLRFAQGGARFLHVPQTLYSVRSHEGREVGLHAEARFKALLAHSKELTLLARKK